MATPTAQDKALKEQANKLDRAMLDVWNPITYVQFVTKSLGLTIADFDTFRRYTDELDKKNNRLKSKIGKYSY